MSHPNEEDDYTGHWATSPVQCRNCGRAVVSVMPARFALEDLPVQCDKCLEMACHCITEEAFKELLNK